jgi:hypothetical protein
MDHNGELTSDFRTPLPTIASNPGGRPPQERRTLDWRGLLRAALAATGLIITMLNHRDDYSRTGNNTVQTPLAQFRVGAG